MTLRKIDLGDSLVKHPTYIVLYARCREGLVVGVDRTYLGDGWNFAS
jgi:hypothetical protein